MLDAGAAEAALEAMARGSDQAVASRAILEALLAVDAAKVAAVLATALPPPFTAATIRTRTVLAAAPLSLGSEAIKALAHAAEAAATTPASAETSGCGRGRRPLRAIPKAEVGPAPPATSGGSTTEAAVARPATYDDCTAMSCSADNCGGGRPWAIASAAKA